MNTSEDIRTSGSFICKKWTLFTFAAVGIVVTITMGCLAGKIIDTYVDEYTTTANERQALKESLLIWIWVIAGLGILFHLVGLFGAYKEHFCMTVTYAVLITLGALCSLTYATKSSYFWFETVVDFMICGVSYAFAYDLRRIRALQFANPGMIIISGGQPAPTIINMASNRYSPAGQSYVANPQYSGQYGQPSSGSAPSGWYPPSYSAPENKTNY